MQCALIAWEVDVSVSERRWIIEHWLELGVKGLGVAHSQLSKRDENWFGLLEGHSFGVESPCTSHLLLG